MNTYCELKHRRSLRGAASATVLVLAGGIAAYGGLIPGLPQITWDPIQEGHMMTALAHDLQNIAIISRQLQHMESQAVSLPASVKYRIQGYYQPFYRPYTTNVFGETATWAAAAAGGINSASSAHDTWTKSTPPILPSPLLPQNSFRAPDQLNNLAGIEITDAAAIGALQTVNGLRQNASVTDAAIRTMQAACLGAKNDSRAMQQNCASAGSLLTTQSAQTTNALLGSQIDLLLAEAKEQRDKQAVRLNYDSKIINYQATESTNAVFSASAIQNARLHF